MLLELFGLYSIMSGSSSASSVDRRSSTPIEEEDEMVETSWTLERGKAIERFHLVTGKKVDVEMKGGMSSHIEGNYFYIRDAEDTEVFVIPAHRVSFKQTLSSRTKKPIAPTRVTA